MRFLPPILFILVTLFSHPAKGEGTVVAKVFGSASAKPQATLLNGTAFSTAPRSLSELSLPSNGVVRMGEKTEVESLSGGVVLRRGVTLVANQPGALRKTIEVRAPGYRLQVRGTAQVAFDPGRSLKVVVLEGSVTIGLDSLMGEFETLRPGQLLIVNPSDRRLPEPAEIDIQRLVATSSLVGGKFGDLPSSGKIVAASGSQSTAYSRGDLTATTLLLRGQDNALLVQKRAQGNLPPEIPPKPNQVEKKLFQGVDDLNDPGAVTTDRPFIFATRRSSIQLLETTNFKRDPLNLGRTNTLHIGVIPKFVEVNPGAPDPDYKPVGPPRIHGEITVDPGFFKGATKTFRIDSRRKGGAFSKLEIDAGSKISTPNGVGLSIRPVFGTNIDQSTFQAGTNKNGLLEIESRKGTILIKNHSLLEGGNVSLRGGGAIGRVELNQSIVSARKNITIGAVDLPTGIVIQNSSELTAVAGNISLLSQRADISVDSIQKEIKSGKDITVDSDANGAAGGPGGAVSIRDAQLAGQSIRIRGFSDGGNALVIDGATLNGTQTIQLFAAGSSTLLFKNNVVLNTKLAILSGQTIEVLKNGKVKISGDAEIYANTRNYNDKDSNYGTIKVDGALKNGDFDPKKKFKP